MSINKINLGNIFPRFDALNSDMLDMVERAKSLEQDLDEAVTDEAFAAGMLVMPQPGRPVVLENGTGRVLDHGSPEGAISPVTQEQYDRLKEHIALLKKVIRVLDQPIGGAAKSLAQQVRARGSRLRRM